MKFLLGIDVGTSGSKAVLISTDGEVRATATHEYPSLYPHPLWVEQEPEDWWQATLKSISKVLEKAGAAGGDVIAVGLTGQMHGLVMLDRAGDVLRPAILWNDQRTVKQCEEIETRLGRAERVLELTGNPVLPGFTAPKILWVAQNEPEIYRRCATVLLPKDYIRYRLTGEYFGDVSDASGTALFDVQRRCWSSEMVEALEIPKEWLPEITESAVASTKISLAGATASGLTVGTPVAAGGGDQATGAVGTGVVDEGIMAATIGTSGVVFAASEKYRVEPEGKLHAFCSAVPGQWHLMGVMLSAAGSFRWFRDTLGEEEKRIAAESGRDVYDVLVENAQKSPAGAEGLLFLPYLTGERTPHPDPDARGVFFGLTLRHGKNHMTRSVLEGVSYGLRDSLELMRELGLPVSQMRASGGGAASPFWRQLLADVFATEIVTVNCLEGAPYGAALLAGVAVGVWEDVPSACRSVLKLTTSASPNLGLTGLYDDYYERYRSLYPALAPEFKELAKVTARHGKC